MEKLGIFPDEVMGQDIGELTAAVVSGIVTLEDAIKLVTAKDAIEFQQIAETLVYQRPKLKFQGVGAAGIYR